MKLFLYSLLFIVFHAPLLSEDTEEVFTEIYNNHYWGSPSRSGGGSLPKNLRSYIKILNDFIIRKDIKSILDLGCGDFYYFKTIDLSNIEYTGIDIVPDLIKANNNTYGKVNVNFIHGDVANSEYPKADLVICKHVMQHLPNSEVHKIIEKISKYKYCILLNETSYRLKANRDIIPGKTRPINLRLSPFNLTPTDSHIFTIRGVPHEILIFENTA